MEPTTSPFEAWTESEAKQHITPPSDFDEVKAFIIERDHWQSGAGFTGPMESPDETTAGVLNVGVKKNFTSENVLGEVVSRRSDGPLAKEPERRSSTVTDADEATEAEQQLEAQRDTVLDDWWRSRLLTDILRTHGEGLTAFGAHYLRLRLPRGKLTDDGTLRKKPATMKEALALLYVEALAPDEAVLYTDPNTMQDVGIFSGSYTTPDNQTVRVTEITYLDGEGRTHIKQMYDNGEGFEAVPPYELGGNLLIYESCEPRAFISPQMIEQQKALNTASTCMRVVGNDASFPIRILLNAMPPGRVVVDEETQQKRLVAEPLALAPGAILNLAGLQVEDKDGNLTDVKSPGVASFDAAPIENFIKEMSQRRLSILKEAKQSFVEMSGDATASGESRIQAMAEYERDGEKFTAVLNAAGQWICDTAWLWAKSLMETDSEFGEVAFTTDFRCRFTRPSVSAAVRDAAREDVKAGLLSEETYISEVIGVDSAKETELLMGSERAKLQVRLKQAEIMASMQSAGVGLMQSAEFAGLDAEEAQKLARTDNTEVVQ